MMLHRTILLLAVVVGLAGAQAANAGIIWIDPDDYALKDPISPPGVTLKAILGATTQTPPDPDTIYALADDKGHYPSSNHFFGWHSEGANQPYKVAWRGKWAKLQAEFDTPVSYVSLDFWRNDFSGTELPDEIGFIEAYDASWNLITAMDVHTGVGGQMNTAVISLPNPEIKYIIASGKYVAAGPDTVDHDVLLDNLGYSVQQIPEPGALVLLLGGMAAGVGVFALRRRR